MLCPGCGVEVGPQMRYCAQCARMQGRPENAAMKRTARPLTGDSRHELMPVGALHSNAGILIRSSAALLDIAVFLLLFRCFHMTLAGFFPEHFSMPRERLWRLLMGGWRGLLRMAASPSSALIVTGIIYSAVCEASRLQATPGKFYLGLAVTTVNGERMTFPRALFRGAMKVVSAWPFLLGYLIMMGTWRQQALHDKLAGTIVVDSERGTFTKVIEGVVLAIAVLLIGELFLIGRR